VPFDNFERILKCAPSQVETFVREGDNHLIIEGKFTEPAKDIEYAAAITGFLKRAFPGESVTS
jgi:hypothetical protein